MRRLALGSLVLSASVCACAKPAKPPGPPKLREGKTVVTSCPSEAPALADDELEAKAPLTLTVERICTYGAGDGDRAELDRALAVRVGRPLAEDDVRASIEAVVATRLFDEVSIGAEKRGDGALVHVIVTERPRVEEVVFEGATVAHLTSPVEYGKPIDRFVLFSAGQKIESDYHLHGFGGAKVTYETEATRPGFVRVRYRIAEGAPWKLAKVSFPGASRVSEAEVKKASGLTVGAAFDPTALASAANEIASLYYDRGFVMMRMDEPQRDVAPDGAVTLAWPVQEGERFTVGTLRFSGPSAAKLDAELLSLMKTRPKAVFNRSLLVADLARVREYLVKRGQDVEVVPLTKTDAKDKTVEVEIELRAAGGS